MYVALYHFYISTHSLTRRLTSQNKPSSPLSLFQLTASQGGWQHRFRHIRFLTHFNSQPHKEADNVYKNGRPKFIISTHSLTRRLTTFVISFGIYSSSFQLTASQGGWQPSWYHSEYIPLHFNSQPHKEADTPPIWWYYITIISTHSLTRRLTSNMVDNTSRINISTHSLTRRLTWYAWDSVCNWVISTHSLTRRLTRLLFDRKYPLVISTHSLTRRLTPGRWSRRKRGNISTHSLTRRLTMQAYKFTSW